MKSIKIKLLASLKDLRSSILTLHSLGIVGLSRAFLLLIMLSLRDFIDKRKLQKFRFKLWKLWYNGKTYNPLKKHYDEIRDDYILTHIFTIFGPWYFSCIYAYTLTPSLYPYQNIILRLNLRRWHPNKKKFMTLMHWSCYVTVFRCNYNCYPNN